MAIFGAFGNIWRHMVVLESFWGRFWGRFGLVLGELFEPDHTDTQNLLLTRNGKRAFNFEVVLQHVCVCVCVCACECVCVCVCVCG